MDLEEIAGRLALRFGAGVDGWCAGLPGLVGELASRWGLTVGEPYPQGASSVALRCVLADGRPAALKLSPDREFVAAQAAMLRWFAASGRVPRVYEVAPEALLMEAIEPGVPLDAAPSVAAWSSLMAALHAVEPPDGLDRTLRARCEEFFARIGRRLDDPRIGARITGSMWRTAISRCEALLAGQPTVLLHGDLHFGNVLDGPRGLVAIDPKVCLGDPCFDAVDFVLDAAGGDGVAARCEALATTHGLDGDRLFAWCRVVAPVIAVSLVTQDAEDALTELLELAR